MEELIDVLDENGNKTGKIVTRKQVHEQGLWHRIIVVAIIDNIVKKDKIDIRNVKLQESELEQFRHIIENESIMDRKEFYEKIIAYLK